MERGRSMTLLNDGGAGGTQGNTSGAQGSNQSGAGANVDGNQSWRDSLPDDIKSDPSLQVFNDVPSLAKSYLSTKAHVGKKGVIVPTDKSSDEEWSAFFKSAGQPELDKYEIKAPQGVNANPEAVAKFKEIFHKAGLLPRQAQAVLDAYLPYAQETANSRAEALKAQRQEGLANLKKEWGQGWDKQIGYAKLFMREHGGDGAMEWQSNTDIGNDAMFLKLMAKAGSLMGEDKLRGDGGATTGKTPAEIQSRIDSLMQDPKYLAGDKLKVAEVAELFQQLNS
jgi:hypothetical protein